MIMKRPPMPRLIVSVPSSTLYKFDTRNPHTQTRNDIIWIIKTTLSENQKCKLRATLDEVSTLPLAVIDGSIAAAASYDELQLRPSTEWSELIEYVFRRVYD